MVNEEKLKEQFKLTLLDEYQDHSLRRAGKRFRFDYIWLQLLISLVTGTLCFSFLALLWGLWNLDWLLENLNSMDYMGMAIPAVAGYIVFMVIYLFLTVIWGFAKYSDDRKHLKEYNHHLKKLRMLYRKG